MQRRLAALILTLFVLAGSSQAHAAITLEIFKAAMTLELQVGSPGGPIVKRKLKNDDVINLALGRALGTKVDKKVDILALAGDATTPGPNSLIVVFNPTTRTITTTVWTFSNFVLLNNADFSVNYVVSDASFVATTLGTPAQHGFLASNIAVAGTGKHGGSGALSATATALSGPVSFRENGTLVNGIILKGKLKASGGFLAAIF